MFESRFYHGDARNHAKIAVRVAIVHSRFLELLQRVFESRLLHGDARYRRKIAIRVAIVHLAALSGPFARDIFIGRR